MNYVLLGSYLVTSAAIIVTPGPNAMLMVQHAMQFGRRAVVFNALGSALASLILISISAFGLTTLLGGEILRVLSFVGSIYLIYIGLSAFFSRGEKESLTNDVESINNKDLFKCFYSSFITGISNPKDILFFVLFLPQFIDKNISQVSSQLSLIIGWLVLDIMIMSSYGMFSCFISKLNKRKIVIFKKISGLVISILGLGLLFNSVKEVVF